MEQVGERQNPFGNLQLKWLEGRYVIEGAQGVRLGNQVRKTLCKVPAALALP